jgi:hypothetical protein
MERNDLTWSVVLRKGHLLVVYWLELSLTAFSRRSLRAFTSGCQAEVSAWISLGVHELLSTSRGVWNRAAQDEAFKQQSMASHTSESKGS